MGRLAPPNRRISSTLHYQTFPTPPPKSKGPPPSDTSSCEDGNHARLGSSHSEHDASPLPVKQLLVLAFMSLSEQTALNSIGPYLPQMASTFPEVGETQVGVYVGTIVSSFALAQFATGFFWGWLSDRIGRKPVVIIGTAVTAACFVAFGFCRTLPQAIIVQVLIGLGNGNQGVVSSCLGEITDRSNQSKAFVYLPVIYGLGGITGPVLGGVLVSKNARFTPDNPHPYLLPNLVAALILLVDLLVIMIFLKESLREAQDLPPLGKRVLNMFSWVWQLTSSYRPSYLRLPNKEPQKHGATESRHSAGAASEDEDSDGSEGTRASEDFGPSFFAGNHTSLSNAHIFNRDTILIMVTYLIFQLSNVSYSSLYPIFGQARPPRGRDLSPEEIGFSLAFAGAATILFQLGIFGKLREKMGNKGTYRVCLAGMAIAFVLTPWVGYKDIRKGDGGISNGKVPLYIEICIVLLIKSLAAVGCLTSFLLLITNSAPNHSVLGTLNGIAQTLSAAGRAIGPFLAGGLFSLTANINPKGEAVAFGVFGIIAAVGCLLAFGIRGKGLEADGYDDDEEEITHGAEDDDDDDEDDEEDEDEGENDRQENARRQQQQQHHRPGGSGAGGSGSSQTRR